MKTLANILFIIGISNFNDLIITWLSGDDDWIRESLIKKGEITPSIDNYIEDLCINHGYTYDNFPFEELQTYTDRLQKHLKNNLIIPLL